MSEGSQAGRAAAPAAAVRGAGLAQAISEQFSVQATLGGPRGLLESVVPMTLFSLVYALGATMRTALIAAVVPAVGFTLWRLLARQPVTQAISGLLGIGLGAYLALRSGRAADFVLPSLAKNSAQALAFGLSALVRWPLLGLLLGLLLGEQLHWRQVPARARAYRQATWLWAGMFAFRLAVQVPLWLAGAAAALGLVNVVLGLPLFAVVLWLTWAILRRVPVARPEVSSPPGESGPARTPQGRAAVTPDDARG